MKINVPLLPFSVEFRWRPLPPLRFTSRHLLAIVLLSGLGIYLVTQAIMHQLAMDFHRRLSVDSPNEATGHLEQVANHHSAYLTTTASAYNFAVWVVWRDHRGLAILGFLLVIGSPYASLRRVGPARD